MFCIYCGTRLADDAQFCHQCGKPVSNAGGMQIKQAVGDVKGSVTGLAAGKAALPGGLSASVDQEVDTVEAGGALAGVVLGGESGNIHIGGQQQYGDTVQGNKQKIATEGGAYIAGSVSTNGGDFVGRDKVIQGDEVRGDKSSEAELAALFVPLLAALQQSSTDQRPAALQKAAELQSEVAKGKEANDKRVATLIDGVVALVPGAVSALVSAFASPLLAGVTGPITGFILEKLRAK